VTHDLFPCGPWTGFYNYSPKDKHRMDLNGTFAAGKMSSGGNDDVGPFKIRGDYSAQTLECSWTKTDIGAHSVFYRGFRESKGIGGTWDMGPMNHGGFHIWPKRAGEDEGETEPTEQSEPVSETGGEIELRRVATHEAKH